MFLKFEKYMIIEKFDILKKLKISESTISLTFIILKYLKPENPHEL